MGRGLAALHPLGGISPRYLLYALRATSSALERRATGSTFSAVSGGVVRAHIVAIAPLAEQRRIVDALETQFTRLDAAVATLERVRANLKRYRAAVLKAAVTGRLGSRGGAMAWKWCRLEEIADVKGGLAKGKRRGAGERVRSVPYLRVANVQRGYFDLSEVKEIEATETEIAQLRLRDGDVLFNEGGDRDKLGRGWVWRNEIPECIHQNHVFRARLTQPDTDPRFISWYGNSAAQSYFLREGKQTTNLASINLNVLRKLPILLPPPAEQRRIVEDIDGAVSICDGVDRTVGAALRRVVALRQSLLRLAFSGRLVPQDPADEPASVLLDRIRRERAAAAPATRKPSRSRT